MKYDSNTEKRPSLLTRRTPLRDHLPSQFGQNSGFNEWKKIRKPSVENVGSIGRCSLNIILSLVVTPGRNLKHVYTWDNYSVAVPSSLTKIEFSASNPTTERCHMMAWSHWTRFWVVRTEEFITYFQFCACIKSDCNQRLKLNQSNSFAKRKLRLLVQQVSIIRLDLTVDVSHCFTWNYFYAWKTYILTVKLLKISGFYFKNLKLEKTNKKGDFKCITEGLRRTTSSASSSGCLFYGVFLSSLTFPLIFSPSACI